MTTSPATPPSPTWEEKRTEHFVLLLEPSSYAARSADEIAARAEAAYQRGWEWFGGDQQPPIITVYLAGWLEDTDAPGWLRRAGGLLTVGRDVIWLLASPEQPAFGLEQLVLEVLARASAAAGRALPTGDGSKHEAALRTAGPPPHAGRVLRALGALIAAQHGIGPSLDDTDRAAHQRHVLGKATPRLFEAEDPTASQAADPAEVSFLLFLERAHGRAALARFARAVLTRDPAAASVSA